MIGRVMKKKKEEILLTSSQIARKKFFQNKMAVLGLIIIVIFIVLSVGAPLFTKLDPNQSDLLNIRTCPSGEHLLGTDDLGRDIFTRLLYGGRISIAVGVISMLLQLLIGVTVGTLAGYFGGFVDKVVMRIVDIIMCFPFFVIAIALASVLGGSITNLVLIIGMLMWPGIARIVRSQVLVIKETEFVMAAKALGLNAFEIIISHVLPNVVSSILVASTLSVASGILMEATLSFLNLGVNPPNPSWGNMLVAAQSMSVLKNQWWMWIPAGSAVVMMVLAVNFVGDGLRDALDAKSKVCTED